MFCGKAFIVGALSRVALFLNPLTGGSGLTMGHSGEHLDEFSLGVGFPAGAIMPLWLLRTVGPGAISSLGTETNSEQPLVQVSQG